MEKELPSEIDKALMGATALFTGGGGAVEPEPEEEEELPLGTVAEEAASLAEVVNALPARERARGL